MPPGLPGNLLGGPRRTGRRKRHSVGLRDTKLRVKQGGTKRRVDCSKMKSPKLTTPLPLILTLIPRPCIDRQATARSHRGSTTRAGRQLMISNPPQVETTRCSSLL